MSTIYPTTSKKSITKRPLKRAHVRLAPSTNRLRGVELAAIIAGFGLSSFERSIMPAEHGLLRSRLVRGARFTPQALAYAKKKPHKPMREAGTHATVPRPPKRAPSFEHFINARRFEPIDVSEDPVRSKRVYFALPLSLFENPVANQAYELVKQHAEEVLDSRKLFANNADWRSRCGAILRGCDAIFCLAPDVTLGAGMLAEAAFMHALGKPVHLLTWHEDRAPYVVREGKIKQQPKWDVHNTARYTPNWTWTPIEFYESEPWDDSYSYEDD